MVPELNVVELKAQLESENPPTLIDVREDFEVAIASFKASIHIPLSELSQRVDEIESQGPLVVYCHHGVRSLNGAFILLRNGHQDVKSLAGGIDAWSVYIDQNMPRY